MNAPHRDRYFGSQVISYTSRPHSIKFIFRIYVIHSIILLPETGASSLVYSPTIQLVRTIGGVEELSWRQTQTLASIRIECSPTSKFILRARSVSLCDMYVYIYIYVFLNIQSWMTIKKTVISAQHEFLKPIYLCVHRGIVLIYLDVHQKC